MTAAAVTILGLGIVSYMLKAAGPLLLGSRKMPPWFDRVATLSPGPLLAALVLTSAVVADRAFIFDARIAGLGAACVALWRGAGFVTVVIVAALATAAVRAL
jgi:branched-subunit amino acid transport protein